MTRDKLIYVSNFKLEVKLVAEKNELKSDMSHSFILYTGFSAKKSIFNNKLSFI